MAVVAKSVACLRISGDTVLPTDITERLGTPPTESYHKGDTKRLSSGSEVVRNGGMWLLQAQDKEPEDLNAQVGELLSRLTPDLGVWQSLSRLYRIDLFCGLFMNVSDEGFVLTPATLAGEKRGWGRKGDESNLRPQAEQALGDRRAKGRARLKRRALGAQLVCV